MWRVVPILTYRAFDFSSTTADTDLVLLTALEVIDYRELQLLVRVHAINVSQGQKISLVLYPSSPSPDDPFVDFHGSSNVAKIGFESASAGDLKRANLSGAIGSHLRLVVEVEPTGQPAMITATVSAALAVRAR